VFVGYQNGIICLFDYLSGDITMALFGHLDEVTSFQEFG
jgi:hypothetical protein